MNQCRYYFETVNKLLPAIVVHGRHGPYEAYGSVYEIFIEAGAGTCTFTAQVPLPRQPFSTITCQRSSTCRSRPCFPSGTWLTLHAPEHPGWR
jgi:hypothetical protein